MTYHVAVREIHSQILVFAALEELYELVRDECALHPRSLLKGNYVGRYLDVCFKLLREFAALVSVPEVGNVSELLRFGYGSLTYAGVYEIFALRVCYLGRVYEVSVRYVQVTVVLKHTGVHDLRISHTVEFVKYLRVKRL